MSVGPATKSSRRAVPIGHELQAIAGWLFKEHATDVRRTTRCSGRQQ